MAKSTKQDVDTSKPGVVCGLGSLETFPPTLRLGKQASFFLPRLSSDRLVVELCKYLAGIVVVGKTILGVPILLVVIGR
jgi:hypothetical protein